MQIMNPNIPAGRADLHNHTVASDGLLTSTELIEFAAKKGLQAAAITDHDSTDGIEEGLRAGEKHHVYIVPGIELNTQIDRHEIHILGYFIDPGCGELQEVLAKAREVRKTRAEKMVKKLADLYGFDIQYEEVLEQAKDGGVGRSHIGRVLMSKGYVKDVSEAFDKYLGTDCPAYVGRYKVTPREGIELIEKAGGVPVLAHPGLLPNPSLIYTLIEQGVKGIEAYHSKHTQVQSEEYANIAHQYGLLITGGSDCHGELYDGMPTIGDVSVETEVIASLRSLSRYARYE
jgi:predicted metal-dependent phosphoesterase TrpH